jgi:hypothetical protein
MGRGKLTGVKYILLMYADPAETKAMSSQQRDIVARKHEGVVAELTASGELLDGAGLDYPWDTLTMHWSEDDVTVTQGPLVSGPCQLTAYYVVRCDGPDHARKIAVQLLDFHVTAVEVRRIHT